MLCPFPCSAAQNRNQPAEHSNRMLAMAQEEQKGNKHRHLFIYSTSSYWAPIGYQTQQRMRSLPRRAYNVVGQTVKPVDRIQGGRKHKEEEVERN